MSSDSTITPVSDLAWNLLWNVEDADAGSDGCAEHKDPACLCDVDLSRTAHITYDRAPDDLLEVEDLEDLFGATARMLLARTFGRAFAETRVKVRRNGSTSAHTEAWRDQFDDLRYSFNNEWFVATLGELLERPNQSFESAKAAVGVPEDVRLSHEVLGWLRTIVHGPALSTRKHKTQRFMPLVRRWAQEEGLTAAQCAERLEAQGHEVNANSLYQAMKRQGLITKGRHVITATAKAKRNAPLAEANARRQAEAERKRHHAA